MADILNHPDKDELTDEKEFKFAEGSVLIKTSDGSPLDLKMSIMPTPSKTPRVRRFVALRAFPSVAPTSPRLWAMPAGALTAPRHWPSKPITCMALESTT